MHNDDTGMRILRLAREPADPRTGIFTSGIVSLGPGWRIALYFSGAKHAERIWQSTEAATSRTGAPDPDVRRPVVEHFPAVGRGETLLAHCMSHGRRQFVEVAENFPEECRYVLEALAASGTMTRWRGNRSYRRRNACVSIRNTAAR